MSRYYYRRRSPGHQRAINHIVQAKLLASELGGAIDDVKEYFFSLNNEELQIILDEYERKFGKDKRIYAESAIPKWKRKWKNSESRSGHMSGEVAERLFNLLPQFMPLHKKYQLVESLWNHVCLPSFRTFYINPTVGYNEIETTIRKAIQEEISLYKIPEQMELRFQWLSQGDVTVKQLLLNHFRQQEALLATEAFNKIIHILTSPKANGAKHTIKIGKNQVDIIFTNDANGIQTGLPLSAYGSSGDGCLSVFYTLVIFLGFCFLVAWFMSRY